MKKGERKELDFSKMSFNADDDIDYYFGEAIDEREHGVVIDITADPEEALNAIDNADYDDSGLEDVIISPAYASARKAISSCGNCRKCSCGKKNMRMKPKSAAKRREFVLKIKFYSLAYGKRGRIRVVA